VAVSLLRSLVDLHRRQLFGVIEVRGVGRLGKIYRDARSDLEGKLRHLARTGRGQTFQAQHLRLVLAQVADTARQLEAGMETHMAETGRLAGTLAPRHLTTMVSTMEEKFGRMTPVVQAQQAAVVQGVYPRIKPSLLDKYRRSSRLYGPQAIAAIRDGLAGSIVRGESLDEAVDRISGAHGLFERQRWRAERIVRTEMSYSYGVTNQVAMMDLRRAVPKMRKRLVATFDLNTGKDSKELNGQTVDVDQPFIWEVKDSRGNKTGKVVKYMQPPNRPNDRECVIPWIDDWGGAASIRAPGPVTPTVPRV
jgi:hypothetical protein